MTGSAVQQLDDRTGDECRVLASAVVQLQSLSDRYQSEAVVQQLDVRNGCEPFAVAWLERYSGQAATKGRHPKSTARANSRFNEHRQAATHNSGKSGSARNSGDSAPPLTKPAATSMSGPR
jgi:hypothetical protein